MKKTLSLFVVVFVLFALIVPASAAYNVDWSGYEQPTYSDGFEKGKSLGYDKGYREGHETGYNAGLNIGLEKGKSAREEELRNIQSQLGLYKASTVGLSVLSVALALGGFGYYFFFIKKKKVDFSKPREKAVEAPLSVTKPVSSELLISNSIKPARIVKVRVAKKAPVPAAPPIRPTIPVATPEPETELATVSTVKTELSKKPANPKESVPSLSQDEYFEQHIKNSGMKCGWMKVLRSSLWFWMLVPFILVSGIWSYLIAACPVLPTFEPNEGLYAGYEFLRIIQGGVNLFCIFTLPSKFKKLDSTFLGRGLFYIIFNIFMTLISTTLIGSIIGGIASVGIIVPALYYTPFIIYFYRRKSLFE